jgi:hypothetical protein
VTVTGWRIWYDDGRVLSGAAPSDFTTLPRDGVQVVVLYFDEEAAPGVPLRQIALGHDWYFFNPVSGVHGHNSDSRESILERYGEETILLRGRWTTSEKLESYRVAAMAAEEHP